MDLHDFISLDDLHTLSFEDAQALNKDLSVRSSGEVPAEHKERVLDYLVSALNMGSVDAAIAPMIERLLRELQQVN